MMDSVTPSNPHGAITHAELKSLRPLVPFFFRAIALLSTLLMTTSILANSLSMWRSLAAKPETS